MKSISGLEMLFFFWLGHLFVTTFKTQNIARKRIITTNMVQIESGLKPIIPGKLK
jgi:hypothetical protein